VSSTSRPRPGEAGEGLVDVLVGFLIFGILAAVIVATLATLDRVTAQVSGSTQAATLASQVLAGAQAGSCGGLAGASPSPAARAALTRCTWGLNKVSSLADVTASNPATNATATPVLCTAADASTPAPANAAGVGACYQAANFTFTASLHFTWGWTTPPGASAVSGSLSNPSASWSACSIATGASYTSPDELIRTAIVRWPDLRSKRGYHHRSVTEVGAAPAALESEAVGGLGGLVVEVASPVPQDVGLVVPGFSAPIIAQTAPTGGQGCAVFPFLPPSGGYQVWVGNTSNLTSSPPVSAGLWSVANASAP
jgi:type II secretory pathway pseudopilin PulG